ncbi:hypothetical protein [Paenibacillus sp. Soil787]|uniref:hypothetical protein n=1 Tax=Paenibacillus sp. Soil787 TaxID=1736411 RepID=UPI0007C63718|nr:hypothetical protein [Paenibacillus sp. Soil787]
MTKPKMGLRIAWIIPNVLMYILFLGLTVFVFANTKGLIDMNRPGIWLIMLILLLMIALFSSYRIWKQKVVVQTRNKFTKVEGKYTEAINGSTTS